MSTFSAKVPRFTTCRKTSVIFCGKKKYWNIQHNSHLCKYVDFSQEVMSWYLKLIFIDHIWLKKLPICCLGLFVRDKRSVYLFSDGNLRKDIEIQYWLPFFTERIFSHLTKSVQSDKRRLISASKDFLRVTI